MPRIPDDELERLKTETSLVELIQSQGHKLIKQGKDYLLSCPWHEDKEPSLVVSPDTNLWHCMGACQTGGSVIDWVMKTQGVSFRHACEILLKDTSLASESRNVKRSKKKTLPTLAADSDHQKLLHQVMNYYHETLKTSPEVLQYLEKRGLNHPELINTFKLGYANRTLGYRLPDKSRQEGSNIRGQLQEIGLLRDSGHEHFTGSLVVPVMDEQGYITEAYGRKILGYRLKKGTPQHLYLPGPHQGVWNLQALKAYDEIILCEALIDAMTFWVNGFRNVTASYGTSGFTDDHLEAFEKHQVKRVLIAYDRDDAGNQAAEQLAQKLNEVGIGCFRISFPRNMDANEYALKMSPADKSLALVIKKAQWMGQGEAPETEEETQATPAEQGGEKAAKRDSDHPSLAAKAAPAELAASAIPEKTTEVDAEFKDHDIHITLGDRFYRVRGLNGQVDTLKINLMLKYLEGFHTDKIDLYSAKQRTVFINHASDELCINADIVKKDLGKLLLKLEEIQYEQQQPDEREEPAPMSEQEKQTALDLLKDKNMMQRISEDFKRMGIVGEHSNTLAGYLGCVSRKLEKPLAVMIQSSSAAGKSSLMEAILSLMPDNERVQYSAMTGQSLFYMGETSLRHKILAISEEEGASNASYALKLLQSEGEVTIASTGKDNDSGQLMTQEYTVKGPTMLFMTTTAIDIDEELLNRCLVLSVNESREQTQAIHQLQRSRRTLEGLGDKLQREHIIKLHRNAQRLLKPLVIVNPYADKLTFISDKTRTRRDHEKYLTLIDCIALLHQYQRPIKTTEYNEQTIEYIEVTLDDIALANEIAHDILGRTLDELPPQTRKLLDLIREMVRQECQTLAIEPADYRFTRKQIRAYTGWGNTQLKIHCHRLEEMEYLLVHRGGRGQSFEYELLCDVDEQSQESHLMGLIDVTQLRYDEKKSGQKAQWSGSSRPQVGGVSAPDATPEPNDTKACRESGAESAKNVQAPEKAEASHPNTLAPPIEQWQISTVKLLDLIRQMVEQDCERLGITQCEHRFTRAHIRAYTGWSKTHLKKHCNLLEDMGVLVIRGNGKNNSFEYELVYDEKKSGQKAQRSGVSRPQVGGMSDPDTTPEPNDTKASRESGSESLKNAQGPKKINGTSYPHADVQDAIETEGVSHD